MLRIPDNSFLTSYILAVRVVLVVKLVIPGILYSISSILAFYTSFFNSIIFTASRTGTNL